jgi:hypothetical protein
MSIFVAFHKNYPLLTNDPVYRQIHVGKALSNNNLGFSGDETGDHISDKNPYYSELTGLYWIWKNTKTDFVGLSHYRRFFFAKKPNPGMRLIKLWETIIGKGKKRHGTYYSANIKDTELILTGNEMHQLLKDYDAIVPVGPHMRYSVREHYGKRHQIRNLQTTEQIITELHNDYLSAFHEVMNRNYFSNCNMFVMKREFFDRYMEWLFSILFKLEKRTDMASLDIYQQRLMGFVSERLLDVWLTKNNVNTVRIPVLYFKKLKV